MLLILLQVLVSLNRAWSSWGYNTGTWSELAPLLSRNGFDTVFYCAA